MHQMQSFFPPAPEAQWEKSLRSPGSEKSRRQKRSRSKSPARGSPQKRPRRSQSPMLSNSPTSPAGSPSGYHPPVKEYAYPQEERSDDETGMTNPAHISDFMTWLTDVLLGVLHDRRLNWQIELSLTGSTALMLYQQKYDLGNTPIVPVDLDVVIDIPVNPSMVEDLILMFSEACSEKSITKFWGCEMHQTLKGWNVEFCRDNRPIFKVDFVKANSSNKTEPLVINGTNLLVCTLANIKSNLPDRPKQSREALLDHLLSLQHVHNASNQTHNASNQTHNASAGSGVVRPRYIF